MGGNVQQICTLIDWTLQSGGTVQPLASWKITGLRRRLVSQGADEVTFQIPAELDADPVIARDSDIKIFRDGVQWFVGRVTAVSIAATGSQELHQYKVVGPWWYLEQLVFEQTWYLAVNPASKSSSLVGGTRSRVILGQGFNGAYLSTGAQLAEALAWAIAKGAPIQATTGTHATTVSSHTVYQPDAAGWPTLQVPTQEAQDITCAEVIRKALRWTPDAVTWWDYSTNPPTFHVARRADLVAQNIAIGNGVEMVQVNPRTDLQVSAICLRFEQVVQTDEIAWTKVTTDIAPPEAINGTDLSDAYRFGALVATIDLMGSKTIRQYSRVVTADINADHANIATRKTWWLDHVPWLADARIANLSIESVTRKSMWPRELVTGAIAPWMAVDSADDTITCRVSYEVRDPATGTLIGPVVTGDVVSVAVTATNASSQTYRNTLVSDGGEAIPDGLAAALFAAVGALQYEGRVILANEDVNTGSAVGLVVNISGGRSEWSGMRALVQEVEDDVDAGRTTVSFGPAQHLGPADLVELLRVNRLRIVRTRLATRDTGQDAGGEIVGQGDRYPDRSSQGAGSGQWDQVGMRSKTDPSLQVTHAGDKTVFMGPDNYQTEFSRFGMSATTWGPSSQGAMSNIDVARISGSGPAHQVIGGLSMQGPQDGSPADAGIHMRLEDLPPLAGRNGVSARFFKLYMPKLDPNQPDEWYVVLGAGPFTY